MTESNRVNEWNASYERGDNWVFYPHEEVIRFLARHVRKRTGVRTFRDAHASKNTPRGLDLGCGIGRHMRLLDDLELDAHGIDLSTVAVTAANEWFIQESRTRLTDRAVVGSVDDLPFDASFFDFVLSHGVLDSMPMSVAIAAVQEVRRTLKRGGVFYFDVVSGDDHAHYPEFAGEEIVRSEHERDTVQSYFNFERLQVLVGAHFEFLECALIRHQSVITPRWSCRYHVVAKAI